MNLRLLGTAIVLILATVTFARAEVFNCTGGDTACLIKNINTADSIGEIDALDLHSSSTATFIGFNELSGGELDYRIQQVSGDGAVVVGSASGLLKRTAYRWSQEEGIVLLTDGTTVSSAWGVSADGNVAVGHDSYKAVRWTRNGIESLGSPPDIVVSGSRGFAASGDGSIVVGEFTWSEGNQGLSQAFHWTPGNGMVGLGYLPGGLGHNSRARAVSADGSVVVGESWSEVGLRAFRWTHQTDMEGLSDSLPGIIASSAIDVSDNGRVIVGYIDSKHGREAFRWTPSEGMVGLGHLQGSSYFSQPHGVSEDGSLIVGEVSFPAPDDDTVEMAFIWDPINEMRGLKDVLVNEYGLNLTGWSLIRAVDVSGDGHTIVGLGINPHGQGEYWVANIPPLKILLEIDIKPGDRHNIINPRSKGNIWVAILSDTDPESPFDPSSQVDIPTVEFGPDGANANRHKVKDINKDGLGDLLLRFKIPETGIACGDTEATLAGETFNGQSFAGTDVIKTVGCKPKKCHKKKHHKEHR